MKAATIKQKNQAMAMRMKAEGIKRTQGRCPVCNRMVKVDMYHHIITCR
jgi:hypothetical protein